MNKFLAAIVLFTLPMSAEERPRARDVGVAPGILAAGPLNAITDVSGVRVGHTTIVRGDNVRTGVTAILPHGGNLFREKVPGAIFVGNGFGKLMGSTQVEELGEIESPILLTNTLSVGRVADAAIDYMLALPGNEDVRSINIVVGETNDGGLNDIRGRHVTRDDVLGAIRTAKGGAVEEGSVGAGTGTIAFGFKGGIGTSSRRLSPKMGGYTVGVLVQTNYGGILTIAGAPVGRGLDATKPSPPQRGGEGGRRPDEGDPHPALRATLSRSRGRGHIADGSIMIVIATDAPVDARNLKRMAARAIMGLARTGAAGTSGSGDYAIAFSTMRGATAFLPNDQMSPLFLATIEATEEAIYNSLFKATSVSSAVGKADALPIDATLHILRESGVIKAAMPDE